MSRQHASISPQENDGNNNLVGNIRRLSSEEEDKGMERTEVELLSKIIKLMLGSKQGSKIHRSPPRFGTSA